MDDEWDRVSAECPLRLADYLHAAGTYVHWLIPCSPHVCCCHKDALIPEGALPTAAQRAAWAAQTQATPDKPAGLPEGYEKWSGA